VVIQQIPARLLDLANQGLDNLVSTAEEKVKFATTMFNLGRASNLDVTDAQKALLKAQTQYVENLVNYKIQLALLESLTGEPITP